MQQGLEGETVGVVDRAGRQVVAGLAQFVAGREQRDPQGAIDRERGKAERGREADFLGAQAASPRQNQGAGFDVFAGAAAIGAALDTKRKSHGTIDDLAVFLHQHRVGAVGQQRAGEDTHGAARRRGRLQRMTGGSAAGHRQHCRRVVGEVVEAHGIAVDCDIVGRRHVARRHQRFGEDAARCVAQGNALDLGDRCQLFLQQRQGGGSRHQLAAEREAIVTQLRHVRYL